MPDLIRLFRIVEGELDVAWLLVNFQVQEALTEVVDRGGPGDLRGLYYSKGLQLRSLLPDLNFLYECMVENALASVFAL